MKINIVNVAFDFGITNTDVVIDNDSKNHFFTFPTEKIDKQFIAKILSSIEVNLNTIKNIAVSHISYFLLLELHQMR